MAQVPWIWGDFIFPKLNGQCSINLGALSVVNVSLTSKNLEIPPAACPKTDWDLLTHPTSPSLQRSAGWSRVPLLLPAHRVAPHVTRVGV